MSNGVAEFPPGFLTIERLITERLILQLATTKGVSPTAPEIENELKLRLQDDPKMLESISGGWPKVLSNLKSLLETGRTENIWLTKNKEG